MTTDPATLSTDFDEVRDVTVIGAGPVGLSTAFWMTVAVLLVAPALVPVRLANVLVSKFVGDRSKS